MPEPIPDVSVNHLRAFTWMRFERFRNVFSDQDRRMTRLRDGMALGDSDGIPG